MSDLFYSHLDQVKFTIEELIEMSKEVDGLENDYPFLQGLDVVQDSPQVILGHFLYRIQERDYCAGDAFVLNGLRFECVGDLEAPDTTDYIVDPGGYSNEALAGQVHELLETIADIWARLAKDRPNDAYALAEGELDNQLQREALERLEKGE